MLLDDGWAGVRVAEALFIDAETVREHQRLYQTAGTAGVAHLKYEGSELALTADQRTTLGVELDTQLYPTAKAVCAFVQRRFAVAYTPHAMATAAEAAGLCLQGAEMRTSQSQRGRTTDVRGGGPWSVDGTGQQRQPAVFRRWDASLVHGACRVWMDPQGPDAGTEEQSRPDEHQHQRGVELAGA